MAWKPDYITGDELGDYLRITDPEEHDPDQLAEWATTASRDIDKACGRQFGRVDAVQTRRYISTYDRRESRYLTPIDDLFSADDLVVTVAGTLLTVDVHFELWPLNAPLNGKPYESIQLTYGGGPLLLTSPNWGWAAVPAGVKTGAKLQGARLSVRPDSPFGVAGSPQLEGGGETRLTAALDPDARSSIRPYIRKWYAA